MKKFIILLIVASSTAGCTMFDYARPHQLWKLNRQKAPLGEGGDSYFSIPAQPLVEDPQSALQE